MEEDRIDPPVTGDWHLMPDLAEELAWYLRRYSPRLKDEEVKAIADKFAADAQTRNDGWRFAVLWHGFMDSVVAGELRQAAKAALRRTRA